MSLNFGWNVIEVMDKIDHELRTPFQSVLGSTKVTNERIIDIWLKTTKIELEKWSTDWLIMSIIWQWIKVQAALVQNPTILDYPPEDRKDYFWSSLSSFLWLIFDVRRPYG